MIRRYAEECDNIVEFGVWRAHGSTWALLAGKPTSMTSVDISYHPNIEQVREAAKREGIDYHFVLGDSATMEIPPCDLLFIDSRHTYKQMTKELLAHSLMVESYIIMHDTVTSWDVDLSTGEEGIGRAIDEFIERHEKAWEVKEHATNQHGLMVLERTT